MPSYEYECQKCKNVYEEIKKIADCDKGTICCGQQAKKIITAPPMVNGYFLGSSKNEGYMSPLSDKFITDASQRRSEMTEFNCIPK